MFRGICLGILFALCCVRTSWSEEQWIWHSESKWDKEWKTGKWSYLEDVPSERARIAVIGGVLIQQYAGANASVLDIGCGEGAIADFLNANQRQKYVGVDLSKEAIHLAKAKRGHPMKFVHAAAHHFQPSHRFDAIVFSDVLYYVEHEKVINQYEQYLNPGGIIIISIFHFTEKLLYENIFQYARKALTYLDEIEIQGYTTKKKDGERIKTYFHIEVYRKKA